MVDGGEFVRHVAGDFFGRMQEDLQRVLFAWCFESYVKFPWNEGVVGRADFFTVEDDVRKAVDGVESECHMAVITVGRRERSFV